MEVGLNFKILKKDMALELSLTHSQSNDAVTLTVTDNAGTYNAGNNPEGWGAPNPVVTNIVVSTDVLNGGSEYHLLLDIVATDKSGTSTTYDTINLYDHALVLDPTFTGFGSVNDLTWTFNPSHFDVSGTAMGASTDKIDDGVYVLTYQLVDNDSHSTVTATWTDGWIIDGDVQYDVYNKLRQVPVDYENENNDKSYDIMEALLAYSYFSAINAHTTPESYTEEISTMIYTLDKMVSNGSIYTW